MHSFPEALRPALARSMQKTESDYAGVTSAEDWPLCAPESELADAEIVGQGLATLGYEVDVKAAFSVWEYYSSDLSAGPGWMDGPRDAEDACIAVESLCENIARGQDYAGFSTINQ